MKRKNILRMIRTMMSVVMTAAVVTFPTDMVVASEGLLQDTDPLAEEDVTDEASSPEGKDIPAKHIFGYKPAGERVVHHDISPLEPALGADDVSESSYISPYFTEVNDQGNTGCCWAFGNTSALEASVKKKYEDDVDFSWKNTAYYAYHKNDVSKNPDSKDYSEFVFKQATFDAGPPQEDYGYYGRNDSRNIDCVGNNTSYLFAGGNTYTAAMLYSRGRCLKEEKGNDALSVDPKNITSDIGNAGTVDTSASDAYRVKDAYVLSTARSNMNNIKAMIKECGAGAISYYASESNSAYVYTPESVAEEFRREYGDVCFADHTITLIGWDDTISASNFSYSESGGYDRYARSEQPAGDGAWICINSWGDDEKVTDKGKTYISYYDSSLNLSDIIFYDVCKKGDENESWLWTDNSLSVESYDDPTAVTDSMARGLALKADDDITLTSVSVFTGEDNSSYTLSVYGNPKVTDQSVSMTQNTPLFTQKVSTGMAGFHVVRLDKAVGIKKGQTALVVLKPDKSIKNFYSKKQSFVEEEADWLDNLYVGHFSMTSDASGLSLVEKSNGSLVKMSDGDTYLQLFSNNGIAGGAVTFEGSDFDMGSLGSGSGSGSGSGEGGETDPAPGIVTGGSYSVTVGTETYNVSWTDSVPYTGYPHVLYGSHKSKATPDIRVVVTKNGQELSASEYKVKFKNNKLLSGTKGKTPQIIIKLSNSCGKEARSLFKKTPLGFDIRKCDISRDLDTTKFDFDTDRYGERVTKLYDLYEKTTGTPVKLKLSKDGRKGDIVADLWESGRDTMTVELRGINNCTGSVSDTFEVEWY